MLFKDSYRKYKAKEAKKKNSEREVGMISTAPSSPVSSDEDRPSLYRSMHELPDLLKKINALSKTIDELKDYVCEKTLGASTEYSSAIDTNYQEHLKEAFMIERNNLSIDAYGVSFDQAHQNLSDRENSPSFKTFS